MISFSEMFILISFELNRFILFHKNDFRASQHQLTTYYEKGPNYSYQLLFILWYRLRVVQVQMIQDL